MGHTCGEESASFGGRGIRILWMDGGDFHVDIFEMYVQAPSRLGLPKLMVALDLKPMLRPD
jgi:hypothetical protein